MSRSRLSTRFLAKFFVMVVFIASLLTTFTMPAAKAQSVAAAPTTPFAVGLRQLTFYRSGRYLPTRVWYPATGTAGGSVISNAPIASGKFPLVLFSHGLTATSATYADLIVPLAAAGFIVAGPDYPYTKTGTSPSIIDVTSGNQSLDASYVITQILLLNDQSSDRFYQHLDTTYGVGAAGHSAGGMTTQGLLSQKKDSRITAAAILSGMSIGTPTGSSANVLFIHGDADTIVRYSSGRSAYTAIPWTKAFLTLVGQGHSGYIRRGGTGYTQSSNTLTDWMRWTLYGDTAAKDRLPADAAGTVTRWETVFR